MRRGLPRVRGRRRSPTPRRSRSLPRSRAGPVPSRPLLLALRRAALGAGQDALEIGLVHEDAPWLGALVARDDPPPLQHVDEAGRTCVADPHTALAHRDA